MDRPWDVHYVDGGPLTVQALLVVDCLNFCFWPDGDLEYEHLARGIKTALLRDPTALQADKLMAMTGAGVRDLVGWSRDLPLQDERARLLREVGRGLYETFGGSAAALVEAAGGSCMRVVQLLTAHFPGFRDSTIYKGHQVFFYKRAQIFAADVYGAFQGQGLGAFTDAHCLTMFADYRVPVVLRVMGILRYSPQLEAKVQSKEQLAAGSEQESEIRAASIIAVERIKLCMHRHFADARGTACGQAEQQPSGAASDSVQQVEQALEDRALQRPLALQVDWFLWTVGELSRATHPPHHRTLTTYY